MQCIMYSLQIAQTVRTGKLKGNLNGSNDYAMHNQCNLDN